MVRFSWLALFALLASFMVFGCTPNEEDDSSDSGVSTDNGGTDTPDPDEGDAGDEGSDETSSAETEMTLAINAHRDEDGDVACPVMKGKVDDPFALASQEYDGKTYYFC